MAEEFGKWIESLKAKINIADVIGSYINLEQKGSRKWACCPFHHEKTPSFCVSEDRNSYYCFGCHKGGDAIKFVMEVENTDFKGAIKILADKYNMQVPAFRDGGAFQQIKKQKDKLYEMMKTAATYYHENLIGSQGGQARQYLNERGLSINTAISFGLGYSLGYNQLVSYLVSKGYDTDQMEEAGLVDCKNGKYSDAMAGRLVTPIINNLKQVIAFGGRVLEKDKLPKYKNTKETILFNKSKELFGQHILKRLRMQEEINSVIMVEGYMDVISLYQAGIKNTLASMGTALTVDQAKLVKRYCDKIYICYDGDSAGQKATLRGLDILSSQNLDVKVMSLTDKLDPDEYVRKYGKDGFLQLMMKAKPLVEYKITKLAESFDLNNADGRGKFAIEAVKVLKALSNPVQVEAYIPLVESLSQISKQTLYSQFNQTVVNNNIATIKQMPKLSSSGFDKAIRYVLYVMFGGVQNLCCNEDLTQYIVDNNQLALFNYVRMNEQNSLTLNDLANFISENPEAQGVLDEGSKTSDENAAKVLEDSLTLIKHQSKQNKIKALAKAIAQSQDEEEKMLFLSQLTQLNKTKK